MAETVLVLAGFADSTGMLPPWAPHLAAVERQANARSIANGENLVRNPQYYIASRS